MADIYFSWALPIRAVASPKLKERVLRSAPVAGALNVFQAEAMQLVAASEDKEVVWIGAAIIPAVALFK